MQELVASMESALYPVVVSINTYLSNYILVFLLIGICGYFTIPSIAGWIVHASGIGSYNRIVTHLGAWTLTHAAGIAGSTIGNVAGRAREGVRRHIDVRSTKINKK